MSNFNRIKTMLKGSTTMPLGSGGQGHVHFHDGVACTHDHSHDHGHSHDHAHDHSHHTDGSCCDQGDACAHEDHK